MHANTPTRHNDPMQQHVLGLVCKFLGSAFVVDAWRWLVAAAATVWMIYLPDEGVRVALSIALGLAGVDFLTGIWAAHATGDAIQSRKMKRSAVKLVGYLVAVWVVFTSLRQVTGSLDIARMTATLLANVLTLTEAVSILENLDRMGAPLPTWVLNLLRQQLRGLDGHGRRLVRPKKDTEP